MKDEVRKKREVLTNKEKQRTKYIPPNTTRFSFSIDTPDKEQHFISSDKNIFIETPGHNYGQVESDKVLSPQHSTFIILIRLSGPEL